MSAIENRLETPIENILYQMHWEADMKHREIGKSLGLPRGTVTRWFIKLEIPTQSCHRFTDKNLTSWLYKTGQLKKKERYSGPDRRIQRTRANVNIDFFKTWSTEMAYVLGFFAADGCMFININGSKYILFTSTDEEILVKIKKIMNANQKIGVKKASLYDPKRKKCYLVQMGSREMFNDLLGFGFTPNKDKTLRFPKVPGKYFSHFVRGYFDGDGSMSFGTYKRKSRNNKIAFYMVSSFTSGSKKFLNILSQQLNSIAGMNRGFLGPKSHNRGYQLTFSRNDTKRLFTYMYKDVNINSKNNCCLERKYNKFIEAFKFEGT